MSFINLTEFLEKIDPEAQKIRDDLKAAEEHFRNKQAEVRKMEEECGHDWSPLKPYYADNTNTTSISSTMPHFKYETSTIYRRQCIHCGKIEGTKKLMPKDPSLVPDFDSKG